jgi:tripartite-type tricarboxylate transporter receptor subunit TctC
MSDLLGGHVKAGFVAVHVALPLAQTNQVRLLGVASLQRAKVAPDVPTLDEQGLSGFEVNLWYGLLAPQGTSPEIVNRYNSVVNEILHDSKIIESLAKQGLSTVGGTPAAFTQFIASDVVKWQKVVKDAGITPAE